MPNAEALPTESAAPSRALTSNDGPSTESAAPSPAVVPNAEKAPPVPTAVTKVASTPIMSTSEPGSLVSANMTVLELAPLPLPPTPTPTGVTNVESTPPVVRLLFGCPVDASISIDDMQSMFGQCIANASPLILRVEGVLITIFNDGACQVFHSLPVSCTDALSYAHVNQCRSVDWTTVGVSHDCSLKLMEHFSGDAPFSWCTALSYLSADVGGRYTFV